MKFFNSFKSLLFLSCLTFFIASCDDPCDGVVCGANGSCDEGICICTTGYSGTNCEIADLCVVNNVDCGDNGTCVDGTCDCDAGFSGTNCEIVDPVINQNPFLNNGNSSIWDCQDTCPSGVYQYEATIVPGATDNEITIQNFGGFAGNLMVTTNGNQFSLGGPVVVNGFNIRNVTGTVNGNTMSVSYENEVGASSWEVCTGTWNQ